MISNCLFVAVLQAHWFGYIISLMGYPFYCYYNTKGNDVTRNNSCSLDTFLYNSIMG